jgi:hypothetical protein
MPLYLKYQTRDGDKSGRFVLVDVRRKHDSTLKIVVTFNNTFLIGS